MRTFVYVDGFNLFYRALKGTSWKWLDHSGEGTSIPPTHGTRGFFAAHTAQRFATVATAGRDSRYQHTETGSLVA